MAQFYGNTTAAMPQPHSWEHAIALLVEATSRLLKCDPSDQHEIERLVELRALALGELMALRTPCPPSLASVLEQIRDDGDEICARLQSVKNAMHSELAGLLQVRSMLDTGLDPFPSAIDFTV